MPIPPDAPSRAVDPNAGGRYLSVHGGGGMICVKDAAMNVVHLGPEWQGFTGLDVGASLGWGWLTAIHPDDRPVALDTLREAARERRGYSMDYRLRHRSGGSVWVSDAAVASFVPEARSFLGVWGAITEIPAADHPAKARGRIGTLRPLPPLPAAVTAATRELLVDYLLLARSLAEAEGDRAIGEALDFALYLARRRLARRPH